jgi:hypothetical protein
VLGLPTRREVKGRVGGRTVRAEGHNFRKLFYAFFMKLQKRVSFEDIDRNALDVVPVEAGSKGPTEPS